MLGLQSFTITDYMIEVVHCLIIMDIIFFLHFLNLCLFSHSCNVCCCAHVHHLIHIMHITHEYTHICIMQDSTSADESQ
jgi:hypothetical protein